MDRINQLTPMPKNMRSEYGWTPEAHKWWQENNEILSEIFWSIYRQAFDEWVESLADISDFQIGRRIEDEGKV